MKITISFILILVLINFIGCKKKVTKDFSTIKSEKIVSSVGDGFKVGFGNAEITPEYFTSNANTSDSKRHSHYNLAGYRFGRRALSVHDPLWARTLVISKGEKNIAIVTLDLIGFQHDDVVVVRNSLPKSLKIDYLVINSTHTHHGPDTLGFWGHGFKSKIRKQYLRLITQQIERSIQEAKNNLKEVELFVGQQSIKNLNLVQDLRPPYVFPDVLTILQFRSQNTTIGSIIHWECHPESLAQDNTAISSDFPHYARSELERLTSAPAIYWNGAIGGLLVPSEKININNKEYNRGTFEFMEAFGKLIGAKSYEISLTAQKVAVDKIEVNSEIFQASLSNFLFKTGTFLGVIKRKLLFNRYFISEVAQIKLGGLTIQTIPGEIFPELVYGPLDAPPFADKPNAPKEEPVLSKLSSGKYYLVLGLAQDELGYIIPQNGWDQRKPFLGKGKMASYGEEMSPTRKFSIILHEIVERLHNMPHNE